MIRVERARDAASIRAVHIAAFGRELEPRIVDGVRATSDFIPELSLVAEEAGDVVGHVLVSGASLDGSEARVLLLGPIGVLPDRQARGIGGSLVRAAPAGARTLGARLVVPERDPAYYSRESSGLRAAKIAQPSRARWNRRYSSRWCS